jgi:hypothetical protein
MCKYTYLLLVLYINVCVHILFFLINIVVVEHICIHIYTDTMHTKNFTLSYLLLCMYMYV